MSDKRRPHRIAMIKLAAFTEEDFESMGVSRDEYYGMTHEAQEELVQNWWRRMTPALEGGERPEAGANLGPNDPSGATSGPEKRG